MKTKLFSIAVLLALVIGLVAPAGQVAAADEVKHIYFTAFSNSICPADSRCNPGELRFLPGGKFFVVGAVDVIKFTALDPRWTAECVFTADPYPPSGPAHAWPISGSFVCTPTDSAYAGGWWEGTISVVLQMQPGKAVSEFRAKGVGTLDGLITICRHSPGEINNIEIIELPGYQPPQP